MALPESIPVKFTEEEAAYLNLRPVVRQTFRIRELVDMILAVTGKDAARVQHILGSGTTVFHSYRYWWQGFQADKSSLSRLLAEFPDPLPNRPFRAEECTALHLEAAPDRMAMRIERAKAAGRKLLRRRSLWECLTSLAQQTPPRYAQYSYEQRADCFAAELAAGQWPEIQRELLQSAPRSLRPALAALPTIARVLYICPRV